MRAIVQRSVGARVVVENETVASFDGDGLVVLIGVTHSDGIEEADWVANKISQLRVMPGESSALDTGAPIIVVSQFTLYAAVKKGRRPSWNKAAPGEHAEPLIARVVDTLKRQGLSVGTGVFGAMMDVSIQNNGPVTIIIDTDGD